MTTIAPGEFSTNIASRRFHSPLLNNSPYEKTYGPTLELLNSHVDKGDDPRLMARFVYKVIMKKIQKHITGLELSTKNFNNT